MLVLLYTVHLIYNLLTILICPDLHFYTGPQSTGEPMVSPPPSNPPFLLEERMPAHLVEEFAYQRQVLVRAGSGQFITCDLSSSGTQQIDQLKNETLTYDGWEEDCITYLIG